MSNGIEDLRRRLFETIDGVKAGTVTLEQARVVSDLSQVIVNTAKVEVDYVRARNGDSSSPFIEGPPPVRDPDAPPPPLPVPAAAQAWPAVPGNGIAGITRHQLGR